MKSHIYQANDKFFKLSMREIAVAKEFFNAHLPSEILSNIDLSTLKLEKESFIDPAYKDTEADVVYSAKMGRATTAYLYLLKSKLKQQGLLYQDLCYNMSLMEVSKGIKIC